MQILKTNEFAFRRIGDHSRNRIGKIIFPPAFATAIVAMLLGLVVLMGPSFAATPPSATYDCSDIGCRFTANCGDKDCPAEVCDGCKLDPNNDGEDEKANCDCFEI